MKIFIPTISMAWNIVHLFIFWNFFGFIYADLQTFLISFQMVTASKLN